MDKLSKKMWGEPDPLGGSINEKLPRRNCPICDRPANSASGGASPPHYTISCSRDGHTISFSGSDPTDAVEAWDSFATSNASCDACQADTEVREMEAFEAGIRKGMCDDPFHRKQEYQIKKLVAAYKDSRKEQEGDQQ